jgi:hypothetical protein
MGLDAFDVGGGREEEWLGLGDSDLSVFISAGLWFVKITGPAFIPNCFVACQHSCSNVSMAEVWAPVSVVHSTDDESKLCIYK